MEEEDVPLSKRDLNDPSAYENKRHLFKREESKEKNVGRASERIFRGAREQDLRHRERDRGTRDDGERAAKPPSIKINKRENRNLSHAQHSDALDLQKENLDHRISRSHLKVRSQRSDPSLVSYNQEIAQAAREKNIRKAEEIFDKVIKDGLKPDVYTYSSFIQAYIKTNHLTQAIQTFHDMQEAGIKPSEVTYNILLNLYVKREDVKGVKDILDQMHMANLHPTKVTYNTILNLYVKREDAEGVKDVLDQMHMANLHPTEVTYSTLLHLYAKREDAEGAKDVLDQMHKANLHPTEVTYNTLLHLYVKREDAEGVENVLDQMHQANLHPTKVTINILLDFYVQKRDLEIAERLFHDIAHLYPLRQENDQDLLDCHGLSYGGACILIHRYLTAKESISSFIIVTGIGHHSDRDLYEMKNRVKDFIQEYHPTVDLEEDSLNLGRLYCKKDQKIELQTIN